MTTTTVKERPILFNGEMVRAILDGRKTQTRGVMNPQPSTEWYPSHYCEIHGYNRDGELDPTIIKGWGACSDDGEEGYVCPYGHPGDHLWVRETWGLATEEHSQRWEKGTVLYRADHGISIGGPEIDLMRWRPSIHMRRQHSRITLEVTDVRVERVQDIDYEGALAEGARVPMRELIPDPFSIGTGYFKELWDSINAKRGYGWDTNPYVWVISFKRVDELPGK